MNRNLIFLPFLALVLPPSSAQVFMRPLDNAAQMAMGGATVAFASPEEGLSNPAQLGANYRTQVSAWSALPYGLVAVRAHGLQACLPINHHSGIALSIAHTGMDVYAEQRFQGSYGLKLSEKWCIGGSFYVPRVTAQEYGARTGVRFGLGMLLKPVDALSIGALIDDPLPKQGPQDFSLSTMRIGASWRMSGIVEWRMEVSKSLRTPPQTHFGVLYRAQQGFLMRIGVRNQPLRMAFGLGMDLLKGIRCDIASEWHTVLGWTPALMLTWCRPGRG